MKGKVGFGGKRMIFKRAVAKLHAQDWGAILIELGIVILGVFIGTLVANLNQERLESAETAQRLEQLKPEVKRIQARAAFVRAYYAITHRYADIAFAGWALDSNVSDSEFVIAAYQASQIKAMSTTTESWANVLGADQMRDIDDPDIRDPLMRLMTFPAENLGLNRVMSTYRDEVRSIIPDHAQAKIRKQCGDYFQRPGDLDLALHTDCPVKLDPVVAARTADELRANQGLVRALRLHLALVASQDNDIAIYSKAAEQLEKALER